MFTAENFTFNSLIMVLEEIQLGIVVYDNNSNIIYLNQAAISSCGIPNSIFSSGIKLSWNIMKTHGFFYGEAAITTLKTGKDTITEFVNHIGRHLKCHARPVFTNDNKLQFVITTIRDITKETILEKELQEKSAVINNMTSELEKLKRKKDNTFIRTNSKMRDLVDSLDRVSVTDASILLLGESGVGKSMLAERIHRKSKRKDRKFTVVNCGAIPETLCESEFFGYEKGAFTGAVQSKAGIFENADHGTLFLDEIAELPLQIQVKLLLVLQEGKIKRLGSQKEISVDFRLITATNKDIKEAISSGLFREDLFHRINTVSFNIPPLRDRPEDIKVMLAYFLQFFNEKYGVHKTMSPRLVEFLEAYSWPGNSREMAHTVERLIILSTEDEISTNYLPEDFVSSNNNTRTQIVPLEEAVAETEKKLLIEAKRQFITTRKIAEVLKTSHVTISRKLKAYGINL